MKINYSLKLESVLHIDGEGETEQDCVNDALAKVRADIEVGQIRNFDVLVLKRQEIF